MPHQITPYDCPGPSNPAQAMNIDRFAVFDAQVNLAVPLRGSIQVEVIILTELPCSPKAIFLADIL
jgi:hypothetical protein